MTTSALAPSLTFGRGYCVLDALVMARRALPHMIFRITGDANHAELTSDDGYKFSIFQKDGILSLESATTSSKHEIARSHLFLRQLQSYTGGVIHPKTDDPHLHVDTHFYKASSNRYADLMNLRDSCENFGAEAVLDGLMRASRFDMDTSHIDNCGNDRVLSDAYASHDVYLIPDTVGNYVVPSIVSEVTNSLKAEGLRVAPEADNLPQEATTGIIKVTTPHPHQVGQTDQAAHVLVNILAVDAALLDFCRRNPEVLDGYTVIAIPPAPSVSSHAGRNAASLYKGMKDALLKDAIPAEEFMLKARKALKWDGVESTTMFQQAKGDVRDEGSVPAGIVIPKEDWKSLCSSNGWKHNASALKDILNLAMTRENVKAKLYPGMTPSQDIVAISSGRENTRQTGAAQYAYVAIGSSLCRTKLSKTSDVVVSLCGVPGAIKDVQDALFAVFDTASHIEDYKIQQEYASLSNAPKKKTTLQR